MTIDIFFRNPLCFLLVLSLFFLGSPILSCATGIVTDSHRNGSAGFETLTVETAVRMALERNTSILSARAVWQAKKPLEEVAIAPSDPIIEFLYGGGNQGQHTPYGTGTGWSLFQNMLFPGKSWIDKAIVRDRSALFYDDYQNKRRLLENQVEKSCYNLLLSQKRLQENERFLGWLIQVRSIARIRAVSGKVPILDYLSAKNAVKQANLRRIALDQQVAAARRQLNTLLSFPIETRIAIRMVPIPDKPPHDIDRFGDLPGLLSKSRPDIQGSGTILEMMVHKLFRAEMNDLPDFQLQGTEGEFGCYGTSNTNCYSLGLLFNLPVFAPISQNPRISSLKKKVESQKWLTIWKKSIALTRTLNARTRALMAYRAFWINERQILPDADLAFRLALREYETQKISFLYLSTSVNTLHRARYLRFKSLVTYYQDLSDLDAESGTSFLWRESKETAGEIPRNAPVSPPR